MIFLKGFIVVLTVVLGAFGGYLIFVDAPQIVAPIVCAVAGFVGMVGAMMGTGKTKGDNSCDCS